MSTATPELRPGREVSVEHPYRICVVCTGNICRSPMMEVVLRYDLSEAGLADLVQVDSAGTDDYHVGERADARAVQALREAGYDAGSHRGRVYEDAWSRERDLVLVAARRHADRLRQLPSGDAAPLHLVRVFDQGTEDPAPDLEDPWYGDAEDFAVCLEQIRAASAGLVQTLGMHIPARRQER